MSAEEMKNSLDNFDTNQNQDETIKNLHESLKDSGVRKELMTITKDGLKFLEESEKDSLISSCKDLISQLLPDIKKNKNGEVDCNLNGGLTNKERANVGILYLYTALTTGKPNPWAEDVNTAYKSIVAEKIQNEELTNEISENIKPLETIQVDKIDIAEKPQIKLETDKIEESVQKKQDQMIKINEEQKTRKNYNSFKDAGYISEDKINFKKENKFNAEKIENIIERNLGSSKLESDSGIDIQSLISDAIENGKLKNNKKYVFVKGIPSEEIETAKSTAITNSKTMEYLGYIKSNSIFGETIKINNGNGTFTYAQMFESSDNEKIDKKKDDISNLDINTKIDNQENKVDKSKNKLSVGQIFPEKFFIENSDIKKEEFYEFLEKANITLSKEGETETLEFIFENVPFSKTINGKEVENTDKLNFDKLKIKIISTDTGNYSFSLTIPDENTFNIINNLNKGNVDNSKTDTNTLLINIGSENGVELKKYFEGMNLSNLQGKAILAPVLIMLLIDVPLRKREINKTKSQDIKDVTNTTEQQTTEQIYTKNEYYDILKRKGDIVESSLDISDKDIRKLKTKNIESQLKAILKTDNIGVHGSSTLEITLMKAIRDGRIDNKKEYIFVKGMLSQSVSVASSSMNHNISSIRSQSNILGEDALDTPLFIKNKNGTVIYLKMFEKKSINTKNI